MRTTSKPVQVRKAARSKNPMLSSKKKSELAKVMLVDKKPVVMCPFCNPPHPISPEGSLCGTRLVLLAEQVTYHGATCALCGKKDGNIVRVGNFFRHSHDCSPGKIVFTQPPKPSRSAALVFRFKGLHLWIGKKFGKVPVAINNADGSPSGRYAWYEVP